jgi:hypothetical protein
MSFTNQTYPMPYGFGKKKSTKKRALTRDEVREIRKSDKPSKELAKIYERSESVICNVKNYNTYKGVK